MNTPTATVTDIGTEFGVDVDGGATDSLVFVGSVKVNTVVGDGQKQAGEVTLIENQSARVERQGGKQYVVRRVEVKPDGFVRPDQIQEWLAMAREAAAKRKKAVETPQQLPPEQWNTPDMPPAGEGDAYAKLVLSLNPAVYFRMEKPKEEKDAAMIFDDAPGGHHGVLAWDKNPDYPTPEYTPGRFGESLWFRGVFAHDYAIVPDYPKATNDQVSVSVWVWVTDRQPWARIATNWGETKTGQFHLALCGTDGDLAVGVTQRNGRNVAVREGATHYVPLAEWIHVAFVADGTTLRLYRNGKEVGSVACAGVLPNPPMASLGIGCKTNNAGTSLAQNQASTPALWMGRIDELAVFNRALTSEEIKTLAEAPAPKTEN